MGKCCTSVRCVHINDGNMQLLKNGTNCIPSHHLSLVTLEKNLQTEATAKLYSSSKFPFIISLYYPPYISYIRHSLRSSRKSVHERPRNSDGWQVEWSVLRAIWLKRQDP